MMFFLLQRMRNVHTRSNQMEPPLVSQLTNKDDQKALNEETYTHFKNLISTFPTASGGSHNQLYRHLDGWYASMPAMVGSMITQKHFTAHPSDILLATFPKSGTTWLKALLFLTLNRPSSLQNNPLTSSNPHELVPFLESQVYINNLIPDLDQLSAPRLFSTHIPYCSLPNSVFTSECKIVYLCRDAKDNFISLWHFVNKLREKDGKEKVSLEEALEQFCNGVSMFGPYWDHVLGYWNGHKERTQQVLFMKYEEIRQDPVREVKRLAEFCGCGFREEEKRERVVEKIVTMCGLNNLVNLEVNKSGETELVHGSVENNMFFRRGVVGDWMNHLSSELAHRIDEISKTKFEGCGLKL
ncbi:hypothetical protein LUZ60_014842 [Juncus effusus]|nr:hypothetical protein LUZ60_014842 [Juncus effusus]